MHKISVVIPVRNGGADLDACLQSLARSTRKPDELIVVDDGSTDSSAATAERFGARVIPAGPGGRGPARARNLGARYATGSLICFFDADVCVRPDTIARIEHAFDEQRDLDAVIGSYDDTPAHTAFFSRYKNLQHCFVHHQGRRRASTFWTGCGAVRRDVFLAHEGFDTAYQRPCIEDIELGYRMARAGRQMLLDPSIQVTHLKCWTFPGLVRTDFFDRALPWTELILRDKNLPNDLNLKRSQRVSAILACLTALLAAASTWFDTGATLAGWLAAIHAMLAFCWTDAARRGNRPAQFCGALWASTAALLAWSAGATIPAALIVAVLLAVNTRRRAPLAFAALEAAAALLLLAPQPLAAAALLAMTTVIVLNLDFYRFLGAAGGPAFAVASIPIHLLYFLYSVLGFAVGTIRYSIRPRAPRPVSVPLREDE